MKIWSDISTPVRMGWVMGLNAFLSTGAGTRLGRFWPTIGLGIRVLFVGLVLGLVLQTRPVDYIPWLASGWAVWGMMSSAITGGSSSMASDKGLMLAVPMPKESFVLKVIARETLLLAQNAVLVIAVVLVFAKPLGLELLLVLPAVLVTALFLQGVGMTLSPLVAKYRDLGSLISSIIGVMFFVLPIMWRPESIQSELAHLILGLNPLYHYLQIIRLPLIGEVPTDINYYLSIAGAFVALAIGSMVMNKTRNKIVYWA